MSQELMVATSVGEIANAYAAKNVFTDYQERKAANTRRRQRGDLALFSTFLAQAGLRVRAEDLYTTPDAWAGITYGLVEAFVRWQLAAGYAIGAVNVRLATIQRYCQLAAKAGVLAPDTYALITLVEGYTHKEGRNLDERREQTRVGQKKAMPVPISKEQAELLKHGQPDTAQGRRDALLLCLLLDHGLRCGEIAALQVSHLDMATGHLIFYRPKVDIIQTHRLTVDTAQALRRYLEVCSPQSTLLMGSRKGGRLQGAMKERSITERVNVLCTRIGLQGASAHDGRHAFVTFALRGGTDLRTLQDAGGWKSIAMPARYAQAQVIANEGVKLG